jgi:hypothetical protein
MIADEARSAAALLAQCHRGRVHQGTADIVSFPRGRAFVSS